jgi:hypothetical protein
MTKSAEKPGVQAESLYGRKPVFAVAPMIDWTEIVKKDVISMCEILL